MKTIVLYVLQTYEFTCYSHIWLICFHQETYDTCLRERIFKHMKMVVSYVFSSTLLMFLTQKHMTHVFKAKIVKHVKMVVSYVCKHVTRMFWGRNISYVCKHITHTYLKEYKEYKKGLYMFHIYRTIDSNTKTYVWTKNLYLQIKHKTFSKDDTEEMPNL